MRIFEPIKIGNIEIKNRLVRSATWLAAASPTGDITDELMARFVELARGGCSMINTGFAYISPQGTMLPGQIGIDNDLRIEGLRKLTKAVHDASPDVKIFCQIVHTGIFRLPFVRQTYADTFAANETKDPFVEMGGTGEISPAATEEKIKEVIGQWAEAARRCKEAGFDGVELHFGHSFGPGAWFSPFWNSREDDWGGSVENRARYGLEVTKAVRDAMGPNYPIIAKINCEDGVEGGVTPQDAAYFASKLVEVGLDGIEVSGGSPAAPPSLGPSRLARAGREGEKGEGYFAEAAKIIRESVGDKIPVIGVGGWRTPEIMEKHVDSTCDIFAISRPLINDPDIINKWQKNPNTMTGCISCNKCLQGQGIVVCRKDE